MCLVNFSHTDVFTKGPWSWLDNLQDPDLKRLAQSLPQTMLSNKSDSTGKKYLYAFTRGKEWAEKNSEIGVFPVIDVLFALYLQDLAETTRSMQGCCCGSSECNVLGTPACRLRILNSTSYREFRWPSRGATQPLFSGLWSNRNAFFVPPINIHTIFICSLMLS